ncbi:hypothetical protein GGS20DRAFT_213610 [Poronia punctata]|nr:hypothetical protein GGS20DRAFT_213610 [Poronia punctata]
MFHHGGGSAYIKALVIFLLINAVPALSWRGRASTLQTERQSGALKHNSHPPQLLQPVAYLSNSYETTLNELAKLESEPLCHRTAARLLVNNCQLLEGKDDATVLTDSGRMIRDFVDSYAASLAICDLERGSFPIPAECTKFQEPTLSDLPLQDAAHLHVTSAEIDSCLAGLGASDSAWNTWVSYRHKALRFCEAARADNDKAQNIVLFQRLTKIMSKLADEVDEEMERRMRDIDLRAKDVGDRIGNLSPLLEKLEHGLEAADAMLSDQLVQTIRLSHSHLDAGLESAVHLERMLELLLKGVTDSHADMANAHEQSLQLVTEQAKSEAEVVVSTMAAAVAATVALQDQIEVFYLQAAELEHKQDALDQGMQRLIDISVDLTSQYDTHTAFLQQAHNITDEILGKLGDTTSSVKSLNEEFRIQSSLTSWWPYIWCPAASLVLGSYGLAPSLLRNMGLILLGETAGFIISSFSSISFDSIGMTTTYFTGHFMTYFQETYAKHNVTSLASEPQLL